MKVISGPEIVEEQASSTNSEDGCKVDRTAKQYTEIAERFLDGTDL